MSLKYANGIRLISIIMLKYILKQVKKHYMTEILKNIYKNYLNGEIKNVVGEDIPFNEPISPWMEIENDQNNKSIEIIDSIILKLRQTKILQ